LSPDAAERLARPFTARNRKVPASALTPHPFSLPRAVNDS
jgi:hypothetical protein